MVRANFANILDTLAGHAPAGTSPQAVSPEPDASGAVAHASFDFLQALDDMLEHRVAPDRPAAALSDVYAEVISDGAEQTEAAPRDLRQEAVPEPKPGPPAVSCDPRSLALELGLGSSLTAADLKRIRRAFALENHPDRLDPKRREEATRRMTLANMLIDEALLRAGQ